MTYEMERGKHARGQGSGQGWKCPTSEVQPLRGRETMEVVTSYVQPLVRDENALTAECVWVG